MALLDAAYESMIQRSELLASSATGRNFWQVPLRQQIVAEPERRQPEAIRKDSDSASFVEGDPECSAIRRRGLQTLLDAYGSSSRVRGIAGSNPAPATSLKAPLLNELEGFLLGARWATTILDEPPPEDWDESGRAIRCSLSERASIPREKSSHATTATITPRSPPVSRCAVIRKPASTRKPAISATE